MLRSVVLLLAVFALAAPAKAYICDDINEVANGWNGVANIVDEHRDDEWDDEDIEALIEAASLLYDISMAIAEGLTESGTTTEAKRHGRALQRALSNVATLTVDSDIDRIISFMDATTEEIDAIVDLCDDYEG